MSEANQHAGGFGASGTATNSDPRAPGRARVKADLENDMAKLAMFPKLVTAIGLYLNEPVQFSPYYLKNLGEIYKQATELQEGAP